MELYQKYLQWHANIAQYWADHPGQSLALTLVITAIYVIATFTPKRK